MLKIFAVVSGSLWLLGNLVGWLTRPTPPSPMKQNPVVVSLSPRHFDNRLRREQRQLMTIQERCTRRGLVALGLVSHVEPPAAISVRRGAFWEPIQDLWRPGQAQAFYVPGRDTILVVEGAESSIRHELVHAWEDERSPRMKTTATGSLTLDERMAWRAAIEATAIILAGERSLLAKPSASLDANAWLLAYSIAPAWAYERAGSDAARLTALRPISAASVLFGQSPVLPALPTPAPNECVDRIGPLGILTLALVADPKNEASAWKLARSWRGDALRVSNNSVRWTISMSSSRDSTALERLVVRAAKSREQRAQVIVTGRTTGL